MFDKCNTVIEEEVEQLRHLVFVYGTLKKGFSNHGILEGANGVLLANDSTEPKYTMISLTGFPGVLHGGDTSIIGEVYEVDSLERLDILEGHPTFYRREQITTSGGLNAWIYILNRESQLYSMKSRINTGIWEKR